MSQNTEDRAMIIEFSDMLHVKSQQIKSRLRKHFKILPMNGDKRAYDGLGQVEAREIVGRFVPVVHDDIEFLRRRINRRRFMVSLPIDESDVRGRLTDPEGAYAEACIRAMARQFDRVGIEAALANVFTGRDFENTVTFASDGGFTVNATAGSTYEKLLEVQKNWTNNEVGTEEEETMLLLMTGDEEEAFMQEQELINRDFTTKIVVDKGRIKEGAGINFITYGADVPNPLLKVTGGTRNCIAVTARGLAYGLSKEMSISVENRTDLVETKQVNIIGELGAVRTEGILVQDFQTTAS